MNAITNLIDDIKTDIEIGGVQALANNFLGLAIAIIFFVIGAALVGAAIAGFVAIVSTFGSMGGIACLALVVAGVLAHIFD